MLARDECGRAKSWTGVSAGEGNYSSWRVGKGAYLSSLAGLYNRLISASVQLAISLYSTSQSSNSTLTSFTEQWHCINFESSRFICTDVFLCVARQLLQFLGLLHYFITSLQRLYYCSCNQVRAHYIPIWCIHMPYVLFTSYQIVKTHKLTT